MGIEGTDSVSPQKLANAIAASVTDDAGIQRAVDVRSQLAAEVDSCEHPVSRHFLEQLPHHCTLLAMAISDACRGLGKLDPSLPFSGVVVGRGLIEASADLYWLADKRIDHVERTRRTFLAYLQQFETEVRQVVQFSERGGSGPDGAPLDEAIRQGWESLKVSAEETPRANMS